MGACPFEHYTLPTIDFVGGETQELLFHTYFPRVKGKVPFSLSHCRASFTVVDFLNRNGKPVIGPLDMIVRKNDDGYDNLLFLKLTADKTENLDGKFIYQITINEPSTGDTDIPRQGIMLITRNINNN